MPLTDDSQVITQLALLSQQVQTLILLVKSNQEENRAWQKSHEDEDRVSRQDHETRLRDLERSSTELKARTTMMGIIQAAFTSVASALAAFVGRQ
jgi:hypothetical protein